MTPYRSPRETAPHDTLRLVQPLGTGTTIALSTFVAGCATAAAFDWEMQRPLRDASLRWLSPFALLLFALGATLIFFARRLEVWVVLSPAQERVRVVRLAAFTVETTTLRLSSTLAPEYVALGKDTWLLLVGEGGRSAKILPATDMVARSGALERLERALEQARGKTA